MLRPACHHALAAVCAYTVLCSAGCSSPVDLIVEGAPPDTRAVIIADDRDENLSVYGGPNGPFALPFDFKDEDELFVAYYPQSLAELLVATDEPDEMHQLTTVGSGTKFPRSFHAAWRRAPEDTNWRPSNSIPAAFADLQLEMTSPGPCRLLLSKPIRLLSSDECETPIVESPKNPRDVVEPNLPVLTCAHGSVDRPAVPFPVCRPYAPAGTACTAEEIVELPSGTCAPISNRACATELTGDRYLDISAPPNGDGSAGAPFSDLITALADTPLGFTLAIRPGTYVVGAPIVLSTAIEIIGACTDGVRINAPQIDIRSPSLRVRDLSLTTGQLVVHPAADCTFEGVGLDVTARGVQIDDATVSLSRVRVAGSTTYFGPLVAAASSAVVSLTDVTLVGATETALHVASSANARLERVAVIGATARPSGTNFEGGRGVVVDSATITASDLLLDGTDAAGFTAINGADATIVDTMVRNAANRTPSIASQAVFIGSEAQLDARDLAVVSPNTYAVFGVDAEIEIDGLIVDDAWAAPITAPHAVHVVRGEATVRRLQVHGPPTQISAIDAKLTIEDLVVDSVFDGTASLPPTALYVALGSTVAVERAFITGTPGTAIIVQDEYTTAALRDITITKLQPAPVVTTSGILIANSGRVIAERVSISDLAGTGVLALDGQSKLEVTNLSIADIRNVEGQGTSGIGVYVVASATTIDRAHVARTEVGGIYLNAASAWLSNLTLEVERGRPGLFLYTDEAMLKRAELNSVHITSAVSPLPPEFVKDSGSAFTAIGYIVSVADLRIDNAEGQAINLERETAFFIRTAIVNTRGTAIQTASGANASFHGLHIEGTKAGFDGEGTAALWAREAKIVIDGFSITTSDHIAIRIDPSDPLLSLGLGLANGSMTDNRVGIQTPLLENTQFATTNVIVEPNFNIVATVP